MMTVFPLALIMVAFVVACAMVVFLPRRRLVGVAMLTLFIGAAGMLFVTVSYKSVRRGEEVRVTQAPVVPSSFEMPARPSAARVFHDSVSRSASESLPHLAAAEQDPHLAEVASDDQFWLIVPGLDPPSSATAELAMATSPSPAPPAPVRSASSDIPVPDWIDNPPQHGEQGELTFVLTSDPFDNALGCQNDIAERTRHAFRDLVREICRSRSYRNDDLTVEVTEQDLRAVRKDEFWAKRDTSMGEMTQLYQLTTFDKETQARVGARIDRAIADDRALQAGVLSSGAVLLVGVLFGCCRLASRNSTDPFAS